MNVTLHDVAKLAGVSIKTVSNVVNDYPHVRADTRQRVNAAIERLGYSPNLSARGLRSGRSDVIGLAIPDLRQNYFAELADLIIRAAKKRKLGVIVEQTGGDLNQEIEVLSGRRLGHVDGLIFSPERLGQEEIDLFKVDFPLVMLGERMIDAPIDHISMDNVGGARAAVEHLFSIGRKRIAIIGAHPDGKASVRSADLRLQGYREALASANLPYDPILVRTAAPWHRENGAEAMHQLLRENVKFDGLVALNDTLALGALRALGVAGVRVPDDVAVIGIDNIDEAQFSLPSLSTIEPGRLEIAELALEMLVERIAEREWHQPARRVTTQFAVMRRESTGFIQQFEAPAM